ncbi:MAG: FecR domain-containing protein [Alphaproteobacteria bacterium]|nr:FecR domain-containing protein [Alphaproteobacteria bacterium]
MGDDYLWDGSGEVDPEVARLEGLLREHRYDREAPEAREPRRGRGWGPLLLAASVLIVAGLAWALFPGSEAGWTLESASCPQCTLAVGEWLDASEPTRLQVADIGHIDVAPASRVRIKATGEREHRLELERGAIHASVVAPPRLLVVETPAADAVDLGCEYDLAIDADGAGRLTVQSGWVALEGAHGTTTVVQGSWAPMRTGEPPGLPRYLTASTAFSAAADRAESDPDGAMDDLLRLARPTDTLTLFHLLPRVQGAERERVLAEIERLGPGRVDRGLDRDAILALDPVESERLLALLVRCCLEK